MQSKYRAGVLAATLAACACACWAQGAATAAKDAKDAKEGKESKDAREAREATEAMERARRLAANPMRVILEASRLRRRTDAEVLPPQVPPPTTGATATTAAEVQARALPSAPREAVVAEPPSAVISSTLSQARSTPEAQRALDANSLPKPIDTPAVALPAMASLLPEIARPTLVSRVDPELPPRLLGELEPNTVVTADLVIRPDGSVSQVNVVSQNARTIHRFVVAALLQWRFAPLPGERQWRVELLFRADS